MGHWRHRHGERRVCPKRRWPEEQVRRDPLCRPMRVVPEIPHWTPSSGFLLPMDSASSLFPIQSSRAIAIGEASRSTCPISCRDYRLRRHSGPSSCPSTLTGRLPGKFETLRTARSGCSCIRLCSPKACRRTSSASWTERCWSTLGATCTCPRPSEWRGNRSSTVLSQGPRQE